MKTTVFSCVDVGKCLEGKLVCIWQTTWHHPQKSNIVVSTVRSFNLTRIVISVHLVFSFYMYVLWT